MKAQETERRVVLQVSEATRRGLRYLAGRWDVTMGEAMELLARRAVEATGLTLEQLQQERP